MAQTAGGLPLVRRGEQDLPLFGNDLAELIISRLQVRYDETPSSVRFDAAEANLIDEVAELFGWNAESGAAMDLMASQSLLTGMPRVLTVAGVLFLTERPREALGKAFIEVRRYVDETTLNYDRREEFDGPAADQVRTATQFVMAELGSDFVVTNLYRHRLPRIPEVVLREAISNAVSHRNYENSGTAIVIELRPGKVILTSPGGLLDPVTEENLRETQAARNPRVISLLRRYRLAEDAGRGIDVMQDEMSANLLDPPRFRDLGHEFEVVLPIHSPIAVEERAWVMEVERQGRVEPQDRLLLIQAARDGRITNADGRTALNADQFEVRASLGRLVKAGLLQRYGSRGGAYYTLAKDIAPPTFRMSIVQLLDYLCEQAAVEPLTNTRVRELAKVNRDDARSLLAMLEDSNRLRRIGERRGTKYIPV